ALRRAGRADGALAGRGARPFDLPRGARPRRRLRARVVARARPAALAAHAAAHAATAGDELMAPGKDDGSGPLIRIGVVGVGYWGPNLVRNLVESPLFDLVGVCDTRAGALDQIAERYPGIPCTTRYEELLQ